MKRVFLAVAILFAAGCAAAPEVSRGANDAAAPDAHDFEVHGAT